MADIEKTPDVRIAATDNANPNVHPASMSGPDDLNGSDDWWIWEVIGVVVSAAAICAIIGLLVRIDGKKAGELGLHRSGADDPWQNHTREDSDHIAELGHFMYQHCGENLYLNPHHQRGWSIEM